MSKNNSNSSTFSQANLDEMKDDNSIKRELNFSDMAVDGVEEENTLPTFDLDTAQLQADYETDDHEFFNQEVNLTDNNEVFSQEKNLDEMSDEAFSNLIDRKFNLGKPSPSSSPSSSDEDIQMLSDNQNEGQSKS